MPEFCKHHIHESMYCGSCYKEALKNANARIASLEAQLAEANKKLGWYQSGEIHTCHADCQRPFCVLHRQLEKAEKVIEFINSEKKYFFTECTLAETIVGMCEEYFAEKEKNGN